LLNLKINFLIIDWGTATQQCLNQLTQLSQQEQGQAAGLLAAGLGFHAGPSTSVSLNMTNSFPLKTVLKYYFYNPICIDYFLYTILIAEYYPTGNHFSQRAMYMMKR
jgi:hypothetical protein